MFNDRSKNTSKSGKKISETRGARCYHILSSSVIYYWTDAQQHGISSLSEIVFTQNLKKQLPLNAAVIWNVMQQKW